MQFSQLQAIHLSTTRKSSLFASFAFPRLMEFMVNMVHGDAPPSPPYQERAAEVHGPRGVPLDGRQQRKGVSDTGSVEETEGNAAVFSYPSYTPRNASTSHREPERVSDVGPTVDSDPGQAANEHSNSDSCAELGIQAAEALLLMNFSREGELGPGETDCDESFGVEDWLDVTCAMDANTNYPGLDLE